MEEDGRGRRRLIMNKFRRRSHRRSSVLSSFLIKEEMPLKYVRDERPAVITRETNGSRFGSEVV